MMAKAQSASHAAAGQDITTRAAGSTVPAGAVPAGAVPAGAVAAGAVPAGAVPARAIPAGTPDAAAIARPGAAARPAASAATSASAATAAALAPAPEATHAESPILAPGIRSAPRADRVPGAAPALSAAAAPSSSWQANLARLERLAEVLSHHGLRARLMTPPGRVPSLHVVNPSAAALAEDVYAGRGQDGLWWFWWSWAERITVGEDLEGAASRIEHVLAVG
jgi:hypothetical protein